MAQRAGADEAERSRSRRLRVMIGDGHRSFVEALVMRLNAEEGLQVVAGVLHGEDALRAARAHALDVAALTVGGPNSFLPRTAELRALRPGVKLVALAEGEDPQLLAQAVRQGFRAWVPKESSVDDLIDAVVGVERGETRIPPRDLTVLLEVLLGDESERDAARAPLASLTPRQRQVLTAMVRGANRDDIAAHLGVSPNTARTHVQNILTKLGVHSSLAAVALARRAGIS